MQVLPRLVLAVAAIFISKSSFCVRADCLPTIPLVLDDIHDGDQKQIKSITWDTFVLQSYPNTSTWTIEGKFDINCVALIDFNVPGKENPPPVPLKMAMWIMESIAYPSAVKLAFEFTDPSETLAPRTQPLNMWLSPALTGPEQPSVVPLVTKRINGTHSSSDSCGIYTPHGEAEIFNDMHDGDQKAVTVDKESLTIQPYANNETWVVESTLDASDCLATVDFNVPGKPNPPDKPLTMGVWGMASISGSDKQGMVYTDLIASPIATPLNVWVPGN